MKEYFDIYDDPIAIMNLKFRSAEKIKDECVYVLDTNVLLEPYKLTNVALSTLNKIYTRLSENNRLFISGHSAKEFAKIRPSKISELVQKINSNKSQIMNYNKLEIPFLENEKNYKDMLAAHEDVKKTIKKYSNKVDLLVQRVEEMRYHDPVSEMYYNCFSDKNILIKEFDKIEEEFDERAEYKIPPGYKDGSKDANRHGDYLIWKHILLLSEEKKCDVVFVTLDLKSDWFIKSDSKAIMPRYELLYEFKTKTGQDVDIITLSKFLKIMDSDSKVVKEVVEVESNYIKRNQMIIDKLNKLEIDKEALTKYIYKLKNEDKLLEAELLTRKKNAFIERQIKLNALKKQWENMRKSEYIEFNENIDSENIERKVPCPNCGEIVMTCDPIHFICPNCGYII